MADSKPKRLKKRIFNSWLTSLISISLVLLMIGLLGAILINAKQLTEYVQEKIGFTLVFHDNINNVEINRLQKTINASDYVKTTRLIDKETAANELAQDLGEDFTGFLGYNPLYVSLEVKLYAKHINPDSLLILEKKFLEYPQIKEVYYQKNLVSVINQNVGRLSLMLIIVSGLLTFIFVVLINNTIRITVYSQRFTINTMQMVGASKRFIRKPFLQQSLFLGIYGTCVAFVILFFGFYSYRTELIDIFPINLKTTLGIVFIVVLAFGLIISFFSTYFAVNKFLKLKFDELFY